MICGLYRVMAVHQSAGGRRLAFCEPRYKNVILGSLGKAFSLPFSFTRRVVRVAAAVVYTV